MVRVTTILARIPVIKFRKGGVSAQGRTPAPSAASASASQPASSTAPGPSPQMQPSSAMSTSSLPDINLPLRYRRIPLSQEEIDHINGGGIV